MNQKKGPKMDNLNLDEPVDFTLEWITYNSRTGQTHQLVDDAGRITACVKGNAFEAEDGWTIFNELWTPVINMGRYVTLEQAKAAAEEMIAMYKAQEFVNRGNTGAVEKFAEELDKKKVN